MRRARGGAERFASHIDSRVPKAVSALILLAMFSALGLMTCSSYDA